MPAAVPGMSPVAPSSHRSPVSAPPPDHATGLSAWRQECSGPQDPVRQMLFVVFSAAIAKTEPFAFSIIGFVPGRFVGRTWLASCCSFCRLGLDRNCAGSRSEAADLIVEPCVPIHLLLRVFARPLPIPEAIVTRFHHWVAEKSSRASSDSRLFRTKSTKSAAALGRRWREEWPEHIFPAADCKVKHHDRGAAVEICSRGACRLARSVQHIEIVDSNGRVLHKRLQTIGRSGNPAEIRRHCRNRFCPKGGHVPALHLRQP